MTTNNFETFNCQQQLHRGKIKPVLTSVRKPHLWLFRVEVAFQDILTIYKGRII